MEATQRDVEIEAQFFIEYVLSIQTFVTVGWKRDYLLNIIEV